VNDVFPFGFVHLFLEGRRHLFPTLAKFLRVNKLKPLPGLSLRRLGGLAGRRGRVADTHDHNQIQNNKYRNDDSFHTRNIYFGFRQIAILAKSKQGRHLACLFHRVATTELEHPTKSFWNARLVERNSRYFCRRNHHHGQTSPMNQQSTPCLN
jgi:hypothetical protein